VINLLKQLQKDFGLTYIFISHDLSVVRHISDDVAVMYLGRIVEFGSAKDVFQDPKHPYTRALLSAIPLHHLPASQRTQRIILQGDLPNPMSPPSGCAFRSRCFMAAPECAQVVPELAPKGKPDHLAACIRVGEEPIVHLRAS